MSGERNTRGSSLILEALATDLVEYVPCVHFSRVPDFLAELRLQRSELVLPYARLAALYRVDAELHIMQHLTLVCGFWGAREYVEVRSYCGQVMTGDDSRAGSLYERQAGEIRTTCEELDLEVRSGSWTWPGGRKPNA